MIYRLLSVICLKACRSPTVLILNTVLLGSTGRILGRPGACFTTRYAFRLGMTCRCEAISLRTAEEGRFGEHERPHAGNRSGSDCTRRSATSRVNLATSKSQCGQVASYDSGVPRFDGHLMIAPGWAKGVRVVCGNPLKFTPESKAEAA